MWWSRSGPRRRVGQCCCRGAPAVKARRAVCKVPSVEGSSAAGLQRCCSKLLLSCDAAGASAAILLNRYRAPPIPQAYKRAFMCSKLRSAQVLRVAQTCCRVPTLPHRHTHTHAVSTACVPLVCTRARSHCRVARVRGTRLRLPTVRGSRRSRGCVRVCALSLNLFRHRRGFHINQYKARKHKTRIHGV